MNKITALLFLFALSGCAAFQQTPPTPFEPKGSTTPPQGLIDYRKREGE